MSELTGKERVRLALEHKTTDRIPIGMLCGGINPPAMRQFDALVIQEKGMTASAYIHGLLDIVEIWSLDIGPDPKDGVDVFGVKRGAISYGEGSYEEIVHSPLKEALTIADISNHTWPDTSLFDYSQVPAMIRKKADVNHQAIILGVANPFETAWAIRGFEQMFMDMMLAPDIIHAIMDRVTCFFEEHFTRFIRASGGIIEYAFTADDVAGQSGLLISEVDYSTFIKPYHTRLNKTLHELGVKVFYHSCGAVTDVVPALMATGIDVLQSLQMSAEGMDPDFLKTAFGDELCFEGGMDVQQWMPNEPVDGIREKSRKLIRVLGQDGGYVFGPSHYIQAGTPPENILAMFETAREYYPY